MDFSLHQYYPEYSDASVSQEQSQKSIPFTMPVSSYFRRPSKIVKSRNQSPMHLVRRRTTAATHGHPRHPSMDQVSRRSHPSELDINQERPLSWHPTSYEQHLETSQYQQANFFPQFDFSTSSFDTAEINGLITPMSAPVANEPQIQEYMTPLEDYSPLNFPNVAFDYEYPSKDSPYYMPEQTYYPDVQAYVPEQLPCGAQYPLLQIYQTQSANYSQLNIHTAPPSPTLLPIQKFNNDRPTSPFLLGSPRVEKEELMGLGLYDRPQDVQSSTLFNGPTSMAALTVGIGKGLKLEESFEPPPREDDEENQEESEGEDEPEEIGLPITGLPITAMTNNPLPPQLYVEDQSNHAGQTFFIDEMDGQRDTPIAAQVGHPYHQHSQWASGSTQPYSWI